MGTASHDRRPATGRSSSSGAATPASGESIGAELSAAFEIVVTDWGALLALAAFACWILAHVPALAPVFVPVWFVAGLAVGLARPWYGLLLTVIIVPFTGGAVEPQTGEVLRIVPVYGAAFRVLVDRFIVAPSFGRPTPHDPPWWVVAAAIAAAGLYALTGVTGYLAAGRDPAFLDAAIRWLVGGAVAMMAAWIAAAHLVAGRDRSLTSVVLAVTIVACVVALAVWGAAEARLSGLPVVDLFTFLPLVEGDRLGALGYPTPTAMGLATALPLAVAAALRIRPLAAVPVVALVLVTMVMTHSRGPLIAVAVGAVVAVLAAGRMDRRIALVGLAAGAVALAGLVAVRYGTSVDAIVNAVNGSMGSDVDRVNTWVAAVTITMANPVFGGGWDALVRVADFAQRRIANSHDVLLDAFASGGFPLGITNAIVILYSGLMIWFRRHTMAVYLMAAVATWLVCGLWDIPQVRSYAAVMGGIVLGMAAGPLIGRTTPETQAGD